MNEKNNTLSWNDFELRIKDWASTANATPPWVRVQFWSEHIVPFITDSYNRGDRAVKAVLDEGRSKMMESVDAAFEWLMSFNDELER